jgi:hypothetical protein
MIPNKPIHEDDPEFIGPKQPKIPDPTTPAKGNPENPYTEPGESKAGRGGIVSPGGSQPKPKEDPRDDSGLPQHKD